MKDRLKELRQGMATSTARKEPLRLRREAAARSLSRGDAEEVVEKVVEEVVEKGVEEVVEKVVEEVIEEAVKEAEYSEDLLELGKDEGEDQDVYSLLSSLDFSGGGR